jgi:hypothetical protein
MLASSRRLVRSLSILAVALFPAWGATEGFALTSSQKRDMLSPRERTFLTIVFSGDESKAAEYAQTASLNPNSIGGEPLSTWFYGLGPVANINVQRIVFERFRQNPNPANVGDMEFLGGFCNMPSLPDNIRTNAQGTPAEKAELQQRQESARRGHVEKIMASFQSLLGYGLKDKAILARIFTGCMEHRMIPKTAAYYDLVFAPMLKAGASIDGYDNHRPLQMAMQDGNPDMVERLVADGADVIYHIPSPTGLPYGQGPCQPRADQSLYRYVFNYVRSNNEEAALRIIQALAFKGLSPMAKWGYGDGGGCKYTTLYDAVIDTGNLAYAARIKEIAGGVGKPAARPAPTPQPVAAAASVANAPAPVVPTRFGSWSISAGADGRPIAATLAANGPPSESGPLQALRLECVAGGKLEYVPVTAKNSPARALWLNGADDNLNEMRLVNGRAAGAFAATLSKEFGTSEANIRRNGTADNWVMEMTVDDSNTPMSNIQMNGFSQMRSYMLAHCKS